MTAEQSKPDSTLYSVNPRTLRTLRTRQGLAQSKLAELARVHRVTISQTEKDGNTKRVRGWKLASIAEALGTDTKTLLSELPDSEFGHEPQIFLDLDTAIEERDFPAARKIMDYVVHKLASALYRAQLDLSEDWIESLRESEVAPPKETPKWYYRTELPKHDLQNFGSFLSAWRNCVGEKRIRPTDLLDGRVPDPLRAAVKTLPIKDNGRLNLYKLRAYFRMRSETAVSGLKLTRFPSLNEELWVVVQAT